MTEEAGKNERALGNITNVKDRGKDFDHHFDIADNSPVNPHQHVPEGHKKAVQMMEHNWDTYDRSPAGQKENRPVENTASHKITIAGDGMGGRKGTNRDWLYGETDEVAQSIPTRKQPSVAAAGVPLTKSAKISIAGDGMGGRKGTDRDWLYNETSETANDEPTNTKPIPGRTPVSNPTPTSEAKENTAKHKINIAGDGMGGRKGTNRDWLYGDVSEQPLPSRRQNTSSKKDDFWDF